MACEPTFSVIVPVFNGGEYLVRAVRSALRQTYAAFELILIDDGSTDQAVEDVRRLGDPRVRMLRQPNEGAAAACNAGLRVACGRYAAFLDQDDLWAPTKLERHLEWFGAHPAIDLTFTWTSFIGETDQNLGLAHARWRGPVTFEQLFVDNVIGPTSSVAIRRDAVERLGGFDTRLRCTYDLDLYLRLLHVHPGGALAIPEILAGYRRHAIQMSQDWQMIHADWHTMLKHLCQAMPRETAGLAPAAAVNMTRYFAYLAYERQRYASGCRLLAEGFSTAPWTFVGDARNWKVGTACWAGLVLPSSVHRRLQTLAGIRPFADGRADRGAITSRG